MKTILSIALLLAAAFAAGCATTPEGRIRREPAVFATFPPAVQDKIRAGQVEVGFTRKMVELALGEPNRRVTRRTAAGEVEIWVYLGEHFSTAHYRVGGGWVRRPYCRRGGWVHGTTVVVEERETVERLRVEFSDGRVVLVEQRE